MFLFVNDIMTQWNKPKFDQWITKLNLGINIVLINNILPKKIKKGKKDKHSSEQNDVTSSQ